MTTDEQESLNRQAKIWMDARRIIAYALAQREGKMLATADHLDFATAVIARLAHNEPPLLICAADEMKE